MVTLSRNEVYRPDDAICTCTAAIWRGRLAEQGPNLAENILRLLTERERMKESSVFEVHNVIKHLIGLPIGRVRGGLARLHRSASLNRSACGY